MQSRFIAEKKETGAWHTVASKEEAFADSKNYMQLQLIDKNHVYVCPFVIEPCFANTRMWGRPINPKTGHFVNSCLSNRNNQQVVRSCGPGGTSTTYKHSPRCLTQTALGASVVREVHESKNNIVSLQSGLLGPVEVAFVNVNMCKGSDEQLMFMRHLQLHDPAVYPLVPHGQFLTACSATIHDPYSAIVNELSIKGTSSANNEAKMFLNPMNLIPKETFHADKLVVVVKDKTTKKTSRSKRMKTEDVNKKQKVSFGAGEAEGNLLELQVYDRSVNLSGRSCIYFDEVMTQIISEMMQSHHRGECRVNLDLFTANMKAVLAKYSGSYLSGNMNHFIEFLSWELGTRFMGHEEQLRLFEGVGQIVLDRIELSRECVAQYDDFSFARRVGSDLIDKSDFKSISLKYKNQRSEDNFLRAKSVHPDDERFIDSLPGPDGNRQKSPREIREERQRKRKSIGKVLKKEPRLLPPRKYTCKDMNKGGIKRMSGIVRLWHSESNLLFRKNFDLRLPTLTES